MSRPTMPANGDKPWGDVVRSAIFDISDRADLALSTASSASSTASTALSTANTANAAATANSSAITTLQTTIAGKADDSVVVKLSGNQTIAGTKTFSSAPTVPDGSFAIAKVNNLQATLDSLQTTTLADGSITNVKVNATAGILLSKTADDAGGAGRLAMTNAERLKLTSAFSGDLNAAMDTYLGNTNTPEEIYAASNGTGAYPARPATQRPIYFYGIDPPANNGSTSGGGGMVPNKDRWFYWQGV